jgi:hypothetical protein
MHALRFKKASYVIGAIALLALLFAVLLYYRATYILDKGEDMTDKSELTITLTEEGFVPQYVRIRAGTKVTLSTTRDKQFWPASNPHPTHGLYTGFDPQKPLQPGESWTFTPKKGVWGYHDHIRSYYTGILYVE